MKNSDRTLKIKRDMAQQRVAELKEKIQRDLQRIAINERVVAECDEALGDRAREDARTDAATIAALRAEVRKLTNDLSAAFDRIDELREAVDEGGDEAELTAETTPALRYVGSLSGWRYSPNGPDAHDADCIWFESEEDALDFHRGLGFFEGGEG